ncbi:MAG: DUF2934 domain-containing protein [Bryobacteraceae bacterium]|jgi:hypothetical protein
MKRPAAAETASDDLAVRTPGQSEVAALAYQLWQDRGSPVGSPDEDWFRAERELSVPTETVAEAAK